MNTLARRKGEPLGSLRALNDAIAKMRGEAMGAQESYGDFASMHEAYGVLAEEVAELFDAVRMRQSDGRMRVDAIAKEAIQVAAVAIRMAEQAGRVTR